MPLSPENEGTKPNRPPNDQIYLCRVKRSAILTPTTHTDTLYQSLLLHTHSNHFSDTTPILKISSDPNAESKASKLYLQKRTKVQASKLQHLQTHQTPYRVELLKSTLSALLSIHGVFTPFTHRMESYLTTFFLYCVPMIRVLSDLHRPEPL